MYYFQKKKIDKLNFEIEKKVKKDIKKSEPHGNLIGWQNPPTPKKIKKNKSISSTKNSESNKVFIRYDTLEQKRFRDRSRRVSSTKIDKESDNMFVELKNLFDKLDI